jgi:hypothetical protein
MELSPHPNDIRVRLVDISLLRARVESGGNFEDYIRFLFCQLFGPVNHRQNWKGWERSGDLRVISDNQAET